MTGKYISSRKIIMMQRKTVNMNMKNDDKILKWIKKITKIVAKQG